MKNRKVLGLAVALSFVGFSYSTLGYAAVWTLGDTREQKCMDGETVISENIKYCHNCTEKQGNKTKWTFHTKCDGKDQRREVQTVLACNSTDGKKNESGQKAAHLAAAKAQLPDSTTACK